MQLRLAFAVAVSVEPEILVIDEVLSVGDMRFQSKCFDRLREFQDAGATILFASHDETQVRRLCSRTLWLQHGHVMADGEPEQVFDAYKLSMRAETERRLEALVGEEQAADEAATEQRFGTREVEIAAVRIHPEDVLAGGPDGGMPTFIELTLTPRAPVDAPIVALSVHRSSDGLKVLDVSTAGDRMLLGRIDAPTTVRLRLDHLGLEPGSYYLDAGVYERDWAYVYDFQSKVCPLHVRSGSGGSFGPPREWSIG
jgi:lipopolysaccharide transport system ATP-binding protein